MVAGDKIPHVRISDYNTPGKIDSDHHPGVMGVLEPPNGYLTRFYIVKDHVDVKKCKVRLIHPYDQEEKQDGKFKKLG